MVWFRVIEIALALTVMINCLSVSVFLLSTNKASRRANRILCLLLLAISVKLSFALLVNFKHEWGFASHILDYFTRTAYLSFGPLLFLYQRTIWKKSTSKLLVWLMFLPILSPFLFHFSNSNIPLWIMQAYLFLHIVAMYYDQLRSTRDKRLSPPNESQRYWIKIVLVSLFAIWMVVNLLFIDRKLYFVELMVIFLAVFYVDIFFAIRLYWLKKGDSREVQKYKNSTLTAEEEKEIVSKLEKLMTVEKYYLDPELTLPKVASIIHVKPYKLSQVINQKLDMTFNEYINSYRIEDVKGALILPKNKDLKIASIAFDYGFNSISVFNTAFKKVENYTPSQFRNEFIMDNQN